MSNERKLEDLREGDTLGGSRIVSARHGTVKDGYPNISQIKTEDGRDHVATGTFAVESWETSVLAKRS